MGKPVKDFLFFLARRMIEIISQLLLHLLYIFHNPTEGSKDELILTSSAHGAEGILNFEHVHRYFLNFTSLFRRIII